MEGTPFGRYRLTELLGRGGMGEVWRAHDTEIDRIVAVKVLPAHLADDETFARRFRREAHAAARLNNPHVIPIHNSGEIDGRLYVDMRLIEGRDLQTLLSDGPLEPERAVRIIEQVAKALQAAHKVGLVHRDVKPSNILLDEDDFAYLIDFGIARGAEETRLTGTGGVIGSWHYMSPERLRAGQVDARADIYALACVLYECLTGRTPYPGDNFEQQITAHLTEPPPRPSSTDPNMPAALDSVIATGMAKKPDERYATTVELARAALDAITVPIRRPTPSPAPNPAPTEQAPSPVTTVADGNPPPPTTLPPAATQQRPEHGLAATEHADRTDQPPTQLAPTWPKPPASRERVKSRPLASPIRRVGAALIDAIPILIAYGGAAGRAATAPQTSQCHYTNGQLAPFDPSRDAEILGCNYFYNATAAWTALVVASLVVMAYSILNWGYLQGKTGSSIGKFVLGYKVLTEETGQPTGLGAKRIIKVAGLTVAALLLGLGIYAFAVMPNLNFGPK